MAVNQYGDISPRTAAWASTELLRRATPYLVLEKFGQAVTVPANKTKLVKFRRYNALPLAVTPITEGVTPGSTAISTTDVSATLVQLGAVVQISDIIQDTHEDPVLAEMTNVLAEQAAQSIEGLRFQVLKGGTNVVYSNNVAGRSSVVAPIQVSTSTPVLTNQNRITRALKRQNGRYITKVLRSTPNWETVNVAASFVCVVHPDLEGDIRSLPNFTPVERYGQMTPYESELGKVNDVRYVTSTLNTSIANAGGTVGTNISTGGSNSDVYLSLYIGADAYGIVALKGMTGVTPMVVNPKPSDSDPLAQRASVGWKALSTAVILNDLWMVRLESTATL